MPHLRPDPCAGLSLAERREHARSANRASLSEAEVAALVPYPELQPLLACNPNLEVSSRARLVSALVHQSARDEGAYESLGILAAAGRLTPFDRALQELVARVEPGRSKVVTLARAHAPGVLLRCPDLSEEILLALDARLVAAKLGDRRRDLAERFGAEWRASAAEALVAPLSEPRVGRLAESPAFHPFLASNPCLEPPPAAVLEAELLRRSRISGDRESYHCLRILAYRGRLSEAALENLVARVTRPTTWMESMSRRSARAAGVVLRCPNVPAAWLVRLDRQLVDSRSTYPRTRLVLHPSANGEVWAAMLRHKPSPSVVQLVWETPEATDCPDVRELLAEYRQRVARREGEG